MHIHCNRSVNMLEKEIIARVKRRDTKAQRMLYDKFKAYWYRICLRYNSGQVDAQDVLQNSLVKIFSNIGQFDIRKGDFKSWSSKIVVNENLMYLRKNRKNWQTADVDEQMDLQSNEHSPVDILSAEALTEMIQNLPEGYRIVFNMYVVEGYSHKEIAQQLKISEGTSKSQLFKAKKLLKQKLEVLL